MLLPRRWPQACPHCQGPLQRAHRRLGEHGRFDPETKRPLRRYRCVAEGCSWSGLLPRRGGSRRRRSRAWLMLALRRLRDGVLTGLPFGAAALAGAAVALAAVFVLRPPNGEALPADRMALLAPAGESHDGAPLPERHPWRQPPPPPAAAADVAIEPLQMRRGCAWGVPGRNPYRGTVQQALAHARLPPEVVREIDRQVKAREVADRLEIRRGRIHAVTLGREYDPDAFAMSFGRTLCLRSRVNFVAGHVEGADLHEAIDAQGRRHAVMVPDVCGNVSVLTEVGEVDHTQVAGVAAAVDPGWSRLARGDDPLPVMSVPEPGTFAAALTALAALAVLLLRRRRRASGSVVRRSAAD